MATEHLDRLHIEVKSVDQNVEELSGGQQQAVAIARATAFDARVVIMDEPTAALAVKEVGKVLDLIKRLRDHGVSVILISHRMDDVFYVSDRVMALFHGRNFAEAPIGETNRNEVIGWIMGTKGHTEALAHDRVHLRWPPTDVTARQAQPRALPRALRHPARRHRDDAAALCAAAGIFPDRPQPDEHPEADRDERAAFDRDVSGHRDRRHRPFRRLGAGARHDVADHGRRGRMAVADRDPARPAGRRCRRPRQRAWADAAAPAASVHHDARHA